VVRDIYNRLTADSGINGKSSTSNFGDQAVQGVSAKAAREEALTTLSSTRMAGYRKLARGPLPLGPSTGLKVSHHRLF